MMTRGYIIGKIIDDLARLQSQIELRNKIGLFDLTKVSEDFFKEILNIIYDLNLTNLNSERSNVPGLDLGDQNSKIAYQITSQANKQKIEKTLGKITATQKEVYENFKIFIIGKKQQSYSINTDKYKDISFSKKNDIVDIVDLTREIAILSIEKLENLLSYFKRSFRTVIIELEPMDKEGNFESSIYNRIESILNSPPKNIRKYSIFNKTPSNSPEELQGFVDLYKLLSSVPKNQREYISIIAERGRLNNDGLKHCYEIHCTKLAGFLNMTESSLFRELAYLEDEKIILLDENRDHFYRENFKYEIGNEFLNYLITFLREANLPIRKTIVTVDFTVLESNE